MLPTSAITRWELGFPFYEYDLESSRRGFIGAKVLRPTPVNLQSATFPKRTIAQLLQTHDTKRGPSGEYSKSDLKFGSDTYTTAEYGHEIPVDERTNKIFGGMVDVEVDTAEQVVDIVLRNYEIACAAAIFNATTWAGSSLTTGVTNEWDKNHKTDAVPIADIIAAKAVVRGLVGRTPNALILNSTVLDNLRQLDQIIDRVKWQGGKDTLVASDTDLLNVLGLKYIIVADSAIKNTANVNATAVLADIWSSEYAMVAIVAETDNPKETCVGRTFVWSGDGVGTAPGTGEQIGMVIEQYRKEEVRGDVMRARTEYGLKVLYPQCAHLLSNVTTL